jgi:toxin-antitoxin system PIN domain toxin
MILLDANVLVYAINVDAPQHPASRRAVDAAIAGSIPLVLVLQVLLEFYAVVTNPRRVAHPLPPDVARQQLVAFAAALPVLDVRPAALTELDTLIQAHHPIGGRVFDLFLTAQMRCHRIATICTYNLADFAAFPGIEAITPEQAVARFGPH